LEQQQLFSVRPSSQTWLEWLGERGLSNPTVAGLIPSNLNQKNDIMITTTNNTTLRDKDSTSIFFVNRTPKQTNAIVKREFIGVRYVYIS